MWWNNVETKPYGGYPQHWDIKLLKMLDESHKKMGRKPIWKSEMEKGTARPYGVYEGLTIFEALPGESTPMGFTPSEVALGYLPGDKEWRFPNIFEDSPYGPLGKRNAFVHSKGTSLPEHEHWFFYLPRLCNHCTYPACLAACPRKAIYKREEDGIVLIDQKRCRGYKKCVEACPYKKPMFRSATRVSEKCIACYPRIEGKDPLSNGKPMETRCMTACVGKIRIQGLVDIDSNGVWKKDPQNPIYFLVHVEKVALPLYPQFGTLPNGYYIPPRWVPRKYLYQMFGPGVDEAIERYTAPSRDLLGLLQLFRTTQKIIFKFEVQKTGEKIYETTINGKKWAMYNDRVIGYDKDGEIVVDTKVLEPIFERKQKDQFGYYKHYNSI
jgi:nitrate reductase beta subunit